MEFNKIYGLWLHIRRLLSYNHGYELTRRSKMHLTKPQPYKFDIDKSIQAVAFLLKQKPDTNFSDEYMRILKLLYIADRESIKKTGFPVTGDVFVAMEYGPTLSKLYDFVKQNRTDNSVWDEYIQKYNDYDIRLIKDPGDGKLCQYEIELLLNISNKYKEKTVWVVSDLTHEFPEWAKNNPGKSSKIIPLQDLLEAVDRGCWLKDILETSKEQRAIDRILKRVS